VRNYNFYLVCGDMFRLLMQPSSGKLNVGSHIVRALRFVFYFKLA